MAEPSLSQTSSIPESLLKIVYSSSGHELRLERQAVRKLDYTILPVMSMFYVLSILDRSNIGNARVAGLQKDLHMNDKQYQTCLAIIFVPHIASALPSSLILRKIGPRVLLPILLIGWGITATLQGFITSYAGLVTLRVFLGLLEGPLVPGIVLYVSSFYTRKELSLRLAVFISASALSGSFSGLLAAAIEKMNGIGGKPGWAWIFILEGLFSVIIGLIGSFFVPSTPGDSKFLTDNMKDIIMRRLERDRPSIKPVDTFSFKEVVRSVTSPHVIITLIVSFMVGTINIGSFLPSVISQLGFSPAKTQLLSVGPHLAGFFLTLISAYLSDRYESRGMVMALSCTVAIAGFSLYLSAEHKLTSYGALYLINSGWGVLSPAISSWIANNSEPHYRRATSITLGIIAGNSGGILSTWSYPTNEGPKFTKTMTRNLIFTVLLVLSSLLNVAYLSWRNQIKKRPEVRAKLLEKYTDAEKGGDGGLSAWMELGDRHPDFIYTL